MGESRDLRKSFTLFAIKSPVFSFAYLPCLYQTRLDVICIEEILTHQSLLVDIGAGVPVSAESAENTAVCLCGRKCLTPLRFGGVRRR